MTLKTRYQTGRRTLGVSLPTDETLQASGRMRRIAVHLPARSAESERWLQRQRLCEGLVHGPGRGASTEGAFSCESDFSTRIKTFPEYPVPQLSSCCFRGPFPQEYETQSSAEAKFVKQLDQCEMILQASEYEDLENRPGRLQDFYDSTAGTPCYFQ